MKSENLTSTRCVIRVSVFETGKILYFGSLRAIFEILSPEVLGATESRLYASRINENNPFENGKCRISKHRVFCMKKNNVPLQK